MNKSGLELYFRSFFAAFFRFEVRTFLKSEQAGNDVFRETADAGIVFAGRFVEFPAFYADSVLGSFQLCLQLLEVLVGFQVRVIFRNSKQTAQGTAYFSLRFLVCGNLFRCQVVYVDVHLGGFGSGRHYGVESFLFMSGIPFDGVDQVWNQVGTTLVLVFYIAPCSAYSLFLSD